MTNSSIADALRARTSELHARAERSGVVARILAASVHPGEYALLLRNLLPVYRALEAGLAEHHARHEAGVGVLHRPELARVSALEHDVTALAGSEWAESLPLLPEATRYVRRVEEAAGGDGARLVAHAYTRYLGDLAGGQVLRRRLAACLGLDADALRFFAFDRIADPRAYARAYRASIDAIGATLLAPAAVLDEGVRAFELNIELSEAVARHG